MTERWDIIIIGAGIGGLAAATSIAQKTSHRIQILERSPELTEAGAGIQITPNASRIFRQWGFEDGFVKIATVPDYMDIRRYATNETIGLVPANVQNYASDGAPHWLVHRIEYQQTLAKAARSLGVVLTFDTKVLHIDSDSLVIQTDKQQYTADLIIGADGIHSRTRRSIPSLNLPLTRAVNFVYRTLIPRAAMLTHPSTTAMINDANQISWAGHTRHIIGYPISNGNFYNLVLVIPDPNSTAPLARYNEPASLQEMQAEFSSGWHESVTTTLSLAESCTKWTLAETPSLPTWRSENGRVVLLGDAAHAMTPHAAQGAAMTIEDAEVLGLCIAKCKSVDDIPHATGAYEQIRKERCERVQEIARDNATTFSMADGGEQEGRDEKLREVKARLLAEVERVRSGEGSFGKVEKDMSERFPGPRVVAWLYGYDAREEADAYLKGVDWRDSEE
jgi:salicylate hydroxylase